jgi:hypothetical protein
MENSYTPILALRIELFKRGIYDFITDKDGVKHTKQEEALTILNDKVHVEFLYGGAAGGAKSWTGCADLYFTRHSFVHSHPSRRIENLASKVPPIPVCIFH